MRSPSPIGTWYWVYVSILDSWSAPYLPQGRFAEDPAAKSKLEWSLYS
ncbi:hypothetical protein [Taibaiella chishuiensis]|nr:hypothetical protein [Taibaiella chishuiensis]